MMARVPPWSVTPPKRLGPTDTITPTAEEAANGWDEESLSRYVAERRAAQAMLLDPAARRKPRPQQAKGHRWNFPARRSWGVEPSWKNRERIK